MAASAVWIYAVPPHPQIRAKAMEVTAIDVGQGDSILLVLPQGRLVLVDAGGIPALDALRPGYRRRCRFALSVVARHQPPGRRWWSRTRMRITSAGMGAVLANFHPRELWLGVDSPSPELQAVLREAGKLAHSSRLAQAGDDFADGRQQCPHSRTGTRSGKPLPGGPMTIAS